MSRNIYSEINSERYDASYDVNILEMKDMSIKTSIPLRKGIPVKFESNDNLVISYFFGQFVYSFTVKVSLINLEEGFYLFHIKSAEIDQNNRKERRKNVEYKAVYWSKEGIQFATVLDISENGLKIRTDKQVKSNKIELFLSGLEDKSNLTINGNIVWETKNKKGKYEYGVLIKSKK